MTRNRTIVIIQVDFLNKTLLEKLTDFITSLIKLGNLGLARALRFFSFEAMAFSINVNSNPSCSLFKTMVGDFHHKFATHILDEIQFLYSS